jgi:hypothetical protein
MRDAGTGYQRVSGSTALMLPKLAATPSNPTPLLSDDLQAIIGLAIVDGAFQQLLLAEPRRALAAFELSTADRRAANAIVGASSLAEYAVLLEQRLAGAQQRRVAVGRARAEPHPEVRKAS